MVTAFNTYYISYTNDVAAALIPERIVNSLRYVEYFNMLESTGQHEVNIDNASSYEGSQQENHLNQTVLQCRRNKVSEGDFFPWVFLLRRQMENDMLNLNTQHLRCNWLSK